ncbi:hypothetical protein C8R44DRAFT_983990 [Mycena epipterygia]|nr:hypothetical protein C8R44DRAFT_983990 [Mycena epipterygia]
MSALFVIVDDQDPKLDFSAGWGPTTGSSISVFSRIGANPQNTTTTLSFAIDNAFVNSTIVKTDQFEHFHKLLFRSPTLMERSHTLVIKLTNITSKDVFLDYLIYEASQNSTLDSSSRLLILDTSPYLAYSQGWSPGIVGLRPGLIEPAVSLNNSVAGAADLGPTVAFNFTGTGFEVRGLLVMPFPSAVATYSLDGGLLTFNGVGSHSLVITPLIPAAFFLDYIIVQSPTAFFPAKGGRRRPTSYNPLHSEFCIISIHSEFYTFAHDPTIGIQSCRPASWSHCRYRVHRRRLIRDRWKGRRPQKEGGLSGNTTAARSDPETANSDFTPYTAVSVAPVFRSKMDRGASTTRSNSNNPGMDVEPPAYIDPSLIPIVAP